MSGCLWKLADEASLCKRVMRLFFFLCFISLTLAKCDNSKKQESFHSFDFSYNDVFTTCFSIKFSNSDTAYIRQHFTRDISDNPKSNTTYFALLSKPDRNTLDSFINNLDFSKFYASYHENYQDGVDYEFYISKDSLEKIVYRHLTDSPDDLDKFGLWLANLKSNLKLYKLDTIINFQSTKFFLPPKVQFPAIKFKPPMELFLMFSWAV